jgi:putative membrane protein
MQSLPTVNALFNALSAFFLLCGYAFIRRKQVANHKACMAAAFVSSTLFLIGYLTYHAQAGTTRFAGQGWVRPVYFAILISHTVLAAVVLPLAITTLIFALKGTFQKHRRIARWTLPVWLYVSVTGVVIYLMLYHLFPSH